MGTYCLPAPTTTLVMPLHIEVTPSILDMVEMAFERLVYMAPGEGFMI